MCCFILEKIIVWGLFQSWESCQKYPRFATFPFITTIKCFPFLLKFHDFFPCIVRLSHSDDFMVSKLLRTLSLMGGLSKVSAFCNLHILFSVHHLGGQIEPTILTILWEYNLMPFSKSFALFSLHIYFSIHTRVHHFPTHTHTHTTHQNNKYVLIRRIYI